MRRSDRPKIYSYAQYRSAVLGIQLLAILLAAANCLGNLSLAFGAEVVETAIRPQAKPNIVVIMADDLGWGDLSCYGATEIETPNIDRLCNQGLKFTSGYCSASTCTPTRYSFLTGRYAFRTKGTGIAPPNAPAIIAEGTPTIASLLRSAGYATGVIGKWHLGLGGPAGPDWNGDIRPGPLEIGFDQCYLLPTTNDRVPQVYVKNHQVVQLNSTDPLWVGENAPSPDHPTGKTHRSTLKMNWSHGHNATIHNGISRIGFYTGGLSARFRDEDLADQWVEQSRTFMRNHHSQPFFLFLASHDIHVPRAVHERFQGKSRLGPRGDAILELDWTVGQITSELEKLGLLNNTLIVVCSDNGPVLDDGYEDQAIEKNGKHRAAGPFRGGKYSVYEGGVRTPLITHWPERIKAGSSDQMVCTIDLAASLANLVGQNVSSDALIDSQNVLGALLGTPGAKGREQLIVQDNGTSGTFGIRRGKWKLLRHDRGQANNLEVEKPLALTKVPRLQLFDLESDPGESNNLFNVETAIAEKLVAELDQITRKN